MKSKKEYVVLYAKCVPEVQSLASTVETCVRDKLK